MKGFITGFDIANTIRMAHSQRRITFLLLEGNTDLLCLRPFLAADACESVPCWGRGNALQAAELLDADREAGFLTVVDADFNHLDAVAPPSQNVCFTDYHDLVVVLLASAALGRVLEERGSTDKITAFEAARGIRVIDAILQAVSPLGYLRWLNQRETLGLDFKELDVAGLLDAGELQMTADRVVKVVAQRSRYGASFNQLRERCDALSNPGHDLRNVCSGHDAVACLGVALRGVIGSQKAGDVRPQTLEIELRLAFRWEDFQKTRLFGDIRRWEAANDGWRVLAA